MPTETPPAPTATAPAPASAAAPAPATPPAAPTQPAAAATAGAPAPASAATPPTPQTPASAPAAPAAPATPAKLELKLPEGASLDQSAVDQIAAFATERKLSQEQAQALLDRDVAAAAAQQAAFRAQVREAWPAAAKADKEIGGEHFEANLQRAKAVYDRFATPELTKWLDETGLGNQPEVLRFVLRIHKATSEDAPLNPQQPAGTAERNPLELLYPTHFPKKA